MSEPAPEAQRSGQRLVSFYGLKPVKASDQLGVDQLPLRQASTFDLRGPAITQVVYVTHPSDERRLVPFADYEEELARDKLNEALRVFTALGASRIVATVNRDDETRGELRAGRGAVGFRIGGDKRSSWDVAFDHRGTGGTSRDPRPLRYPDEPGFDAACEGVLRLGGQRYKIDITRTSQYGVDGELAVRLKKAGFQLGVGGTRTQSNQFVIEAVFGKDAAGELDAVVDATTHDEQRNTGKFSRRRQRGHRAQGNAK